MFGTRRTRATRTHRAPARTGYTTRTRRTHHTAPRTGGGLFSRRRHSPGHRHVATTTTTTHRHAPVAHHHKRKTSMGDKISGALMRIKGSLTRRPGVKAAGTRRMHGTDGRGSRRRYRY